MILLHATCVALGGSGVLLRGRPGAGKSDLALRLIDEGAALVADDYCEIDVARDTLIARAPCRIAGKMEIRGIGIIARDFVPSAPVALVIDLVPGGDIPRMPDVTTTAIEGVTLPWAALDPFTASATAKVRALLDARTLDARTLNTRTKEATAVRPPARVLRP